MRVLFIVPRSHNPKQMYREYPLGVGLLGKVPAKVEELRMKFKVGDSKLKS